MTAITVATITAETTPNPHLDNGVSSTGTTGGATNITVQALFNGLSIGEQAAIINGANWSCTIKGEFSPPGSLTVQASDDAGKVASGNKTISV